MEFVLADWFYRGVIDRSLVLAIDPAYFRLTGGIERWLYRVARKHAGRQPKGWLFEIAHLHEKSGSLVRVSDFALQIRRIVARQPLPGYRLRLERDGRRELLRILPAHLSTVPVDGAVETLGTSHANGIGISHAALSGLRTHEPQLTLWPETVIPGLNLESNSESNSSLLLGAGENIASGLGKATTTSRAKSSPDTVFHNSGLTTTNTSQPQQLPFVRKPGGET
jgi:plasmid replication initiation protein